jgi:hypothetical protein
MEVENSEEQQGVLNTEDTEERGTEIFRGDKKSLRGADPDAGSGGFAEVNRLTGDAESKSLVIATV